MSQELAVIQATIAATAVLLWTAFKFADSEEYIIGLIAQIFHGAGLISMLVTLGLAMEFLPTGKGEGILSGFLIVVTVLVTAYVLLMTSRAIINLVLAGVGIAKDKWEGSRD
jgi:Na+-transporting NADH:ubiquinone oxidoreductase subunit NqrD